jgi:hypothetical protein
LQGPVDPLMLNRRRAKRPSSSTFVRVTLTQIAAELAVSEHTARRLVRKYRWVGLAPHTENGLTTYDAQGLERLKAMKSIPNRAGQDWLARHLEGDPHA